MSKVIIQECKDYSPDDVIDKINSGIEKLGGWDIFVKKGNVVLLKVNLIGPKTSDSAAITHSEFVRALTKILIKRGCTCGLVIVQRSYRRYFTYCSRFKSFWI